MSTPLATDPVARERHLRHIDKVLKSPKVVTTAKLASELSAVESLDIVFIEELIQEGASNGHAIGTTSSVATNEHTNGHANGYAIGYTNGNLNGVNGNHELHDVSEPAFLMLTSGSTGNAKAVECRAAQAYASMKAKSTALASTRADTFLNWIGKHTKAIHLITKMQSLLTIR